MRGLATRWGDSSRCRRVQRRVPPPSSSEQNTEPVLRTASMPTIWTQFTLDCRANSACENCGCWRLALNGASLPNGRSIAMLRFNFYFHASMRSKILAALRRSSMSTSITLRRIYDPVGRSQFRKIALFHLAAFARHDLQDFKRDAIAQRDASIANLGSTMPFLPRSAFTFLAREAGASPNVLNLSRTWIVQRRGVRMSASRAACERTESLAASCIRGYPLVPFAGFPCLPQATT